MSLSTPWELCRINDKIKEDVQVLHEIQCSSPITRLICLTDPLADKKFNETKTECEVSLIYSPDFEYNAPKILFKTQTMNQISVYEQFNPQLKESDYSFNYIHSNIPESAICSTLTTPDTDNTKVLALIKYHDYPGIFIFVVDLSPSMNDKMNLVIQAMLFFVQFLPKNFYFDIYGFGRETEHYSKQPLECNTKGKTIIDIIKSLKADKGITVISSALRLIFLADYSSTRLIQRTSFFSLMERQRRPTNA